MQVILGAVDPYVIATVGIGHPHSARECLIDDGCLESSILQSRSDEIELTARLERKADTSPTTTLKR